MYVSIYLSIYLSIYIHMYILHTYISISCAGVARSRSMSALFTAFALIALLLLLHILFPHLFLPPLKRP